MEEILFHPIGYIKSPFKTTEEIPRQSIYAADKRAIIEINTELQDGLKGLDTKDYIIILFNFHLSNDYKLLLKPHDMDKEAGVFATRAPSRPNPIGLSIVKLLKIEGNRIEIQGVDMVDGTPVLDIKPYSPGLNPENTIEKTHPD